MSEGAFEVYQDTNKQWRFRLKAGNGKVICQSEAYTRKHNCYKGIKSVRAVSSYCKIVELGESN